MKEECIKITKAAYRMLDMLPDADPLKNKAKEKALAIMENTVQLFEHDGWISLKQYLLPDREKISYQLLQDIKMMERYLEIAKNQGWLSGINFLIIIKEYEKIKSSITLPQAQVLRKITVNQKPKSQSPSPVEKREAKALTPKEVFTPRQQRILEILGKKEKAQVADLIKELPKVTKRTIRRDLDDLLKKSRVVRVGEFNQIFYRIKAGV